MTPLPASEETGALGVRHLKRFWARKSSRREDDSSEWAADNTLLCGLHLPLLSTLHFLIEFMPDFDQFEGWILKENGGRIAPQRVEELNLALTGGRPACGGPWEPALNSTEMAFWDENGYVVLHDAVSSEQSRAAAQAIYDFLKMDPDVPDTWYGGPQGHSIWIPPLNHPAIWAIRESPRTRSAFAQIWGRDDLWCSVDQAGMNPPERPGWQFPGPNLHFDMSLALPIPFGVQGILYLTDTAADQGAFTCVPGFHRRIEDWLRGLPPDADPRKQDLTALGPVRIAGRAGDLIIWHHALPHGSSPNRAKVPRVVQYLRMMPSQWDHNPVWK